MNVTEPEGIQSGTSDPRTRSRTQVPQASCLSPHLQKQSMKRASHSNCHYDLSQGRTFSAKVGRNREVCLEKQQVPQLPDPCSQQLSTILTVLTRVMLPAKLCTQLLSELAARKLSVLHLTEQLSADFILPFLTFHDSQLSPVSYHSTMFYTHLHAYMQNILTSRIKYVNKNFL